VVVRPFVLWRWRLRSRLWCAHWWGCAQTRPMLRRFERRDCRWRL